MSKKHTVLVFGTFDSIHKGHLFFLDKAKKLGNLIISVSSDKNTLALKNKKPQKSEKQRKKELEKLNIASKVVIGEKKIGSWKIIKTEKPTIIALGYDQKTLYTALIPLQKIYSFKIRRIKSYKPSLYHSSLLNKNALS